MTHLQSKVDTESVKLTPEKEDKFIADLDKLVNRHSRNMAIDAFASAMGKAVYEGWGSHNYQKFVTGFKEAFESAKESEAE